MSFLSSQDLEVLIKNRGVINQESFDPDSIKRGAYELSLGREVYETSNTSKTVLTSPPSFRKENIQFSIEPGQFAMLLTEERVSIPNGFIGFLSVRSKFKFKGLINVSGFHVDPGYEGHLKFTVYNAGGRSITLTRGSRMFPLWISTMNQKTRDPYPSPKEDNKRDFITDENIDNIKGNPVSVSHLEEEVNSLKTKVNFIAGFAVLAVLSLLSLIITLGLGIIPKT
jgi:dCTP deaminase